MKKILCVIGKSGAGKDTLASAIIDMTEGKKRYGVHKFAAPGKRLFEKLYSLEEGFMDDRVRRLQICPGGETSYLQRFIFWFHNQSNIFPPGLFLKLAMKALHKDLSVLDTIIFTDLRTPQEAKQLTEFCVKYNVELTTVLLVSPGSEHQTSDMHLDLNLSILTRSAKSKPPIVLINDKSIPIYYITKQLISQINAN